MTLGVKLAGVTSSGKKVQRYKTAGSGTLRVLDFKNAATYGAGIVPAVTLPIATPLYDLPDLSVATPATPAYVRGAAMQQSAQGGIPFIGTAASTFIELPNDFKLPVLTDAAGRYLIILSVKPSIATAAAGTEAWAGMADSTGATVCNWALYRNNANANLFCSVAGAFQNFGVISAGVMHRLGLLVEKTATAVQLTAWVDGVQQVQAGAWAGNALGNPVTVTKARLGSMNFGGSIQSLEWGSAEIRNLANDTLDAASIMAADWAAWSTRFN